ncbi:MAG: response regulator [Limosilactobacillus sp.]|jgi:two-component system response regulator YcbB|uniref:DNA-binding domain-containing protein n=1 Tax=Limosilactobacillus sp. TaxID=2773925 RepID=UPI0025BC3348|nr:DNA-binding domain-containing protein [Limosilactobacillus sp.]MCI1974361.1 response regulator [Limosilactobacillus sp.]MCI2030548.1 response regulator [Limosilactobacillus sp.]
MKYYIIDDDQSILYVLQNIIEQNFNDEVVGMNDHSPAALKELLVRDVDIVLVDLLMPELSGIELVKQVKKIKPNTRFVMISKVQDSEMRAKAYQAGIEFFINKPINLIEVKAVLEKVEQNMQMASQLSSISQMINNFNHQATSPQQTSPADQASATLKYLGMASEKGATDILQIIPLMRSHGTNYRNLNLNELLGLTEHQKKVVEQRIRRAIKVGLANTANRLIDNPYDEQLSDLANSLFGYENVHGEMLYQQNKQKSGGRVNLQRFLDGLADADSVN